MAARSEYQALKAYLSRYAEAQKQERRLADRLDRLDKDLGQDGGLDSQPGVSPRERVRDYSDVPGSGSGEKPRNLGNKNQGICPGANARISHAPFPAGAGGQEDNLNRNPLSPGEKDPRIFRKAEMRARCIKDLEEQRAFTASALEGLVKVLGFLPSSSDRRYVLELRYLDSLSWGMVAEVAHMSRSNCFSKASAGIRELLGHSEVQEMIRGQ